MKDKELKGWRARLHKIIFESDTWEGRVFDVVLIWMIMLSVMTVILESVPSISLQYGAVLRAVEWFFTILFTIEYILRIVSVQRPLLYAMSFFGIIDLIAILPTYFSLLYGGLQALLVFRIFRLLRVFRIMKMVRHVTEANVLARALKASKEKITVFILTIISVIILTGSIMYLIEGHGNGFESIPKSMYWSVVTLTTVGYGDVVPVTTLGKFVASILMILGYGIIAVPTGIVSVELAKASIDINVKACDSCGHSGHDSNSKYCKFCGGKL